MQNAMRIALKDGPDRIGWFRGYPAPAGAAGRGQGMIEDSRFAALGHFTDGSGHIENLSKKSFQKLFERITQLTILQRKLDIRF